MDSPGAVQEKDDEVVLLSWLEWPSKEARDSGMKKTMEGSSRARRARIH